MLLLDLQKELMTTGCFKKMLMMLSVTGRESAHY